MIVRFEAGIKGPAPSPKLLASEVLVTLTGLFPTQCTVSVVGVECIREADASVPVTVVVYVPFGLRPPPGGLLLPPQAAWKTKPANSMQASAAAFSFPEV
jgi:hypothetical protein